MTNLSLLFLLLCTYGNSLAMNRFYTNNKLDDGIQINLLDYPDIPPYKMFTQKLNHFSNTDRRMWDQRYFVNDEYYNTSTNDGPMFLMLGGESPLDPIWIVKGAWIEYAEKQGALCFLLEHRYYGESIPVPDISMRNLEYLTSQQALADIAYFITYINAKHQLSADVKWIVFGGSYSGSLAAWMRAKYPHLVYAAVSSSGPLRAEVDFKEYYDAVAQSITAKTGNDVCVEKVRLAHKQVSVLMKIEPETVERDFHLCQPLQNATEMDEKMFLSVVADDFASVVQYNEDNRADFNDDLKNVTINTICDIMMVKDLALFRKLGTVSRFIQNATKQSCLEYNYTKITNQLKLTHWGPYTGRQWFYQTCTEFGFYQTTYGETPVFGKGLDLYFYLKQCRDVFGPKFNRRFLQEVVDATNRYYGGTEITATRVLYVHGTIDPWHVLGVNETKDPSSPVILIEGTAHCANMYPSADTDSDALKAARETIRKQLAAWLDTA